MRRNAWWSQTFANDGGPLIALPHELRGHWRGTEAEYERACDARTPFDLFPAGPGVVVVAASTNSMFYTAQWLRVGGQGGVILVGWDSGGDNDQEDQEWLLSRLSRPGLQWVQHRPRVSVTSGVLLLQHAAGPADDVRLAPADRFASIGDTVPVGIEPGEYALESVAVDETANGEDYCCGLCRWVPAA